MKIFFFICNALALFTFYAVPSSGKQQMHAGPLRLQNGHCCYISQ